MANRPITLNLNLRRVDQSLCNKKPTGSYVDLALFENRDGPDQYGNTHYVVQSVSKEARERGERGPIIGNARVPIDQDAGGKASARPPASKAPPRPPVDPNLEPLDEDQIPF